MQTFDTLQIGESGSFSFGLSPRPVRCGFGLELGRGSVYPELNFTLPPMTISAGTWGAVLAEYKEIAEMIPRAAARLRLPGLMVEFELLPPMTEHPAWGAEITALLRGALEKLHAESRIPCALRVTPTDIRDMERPPLLRSGKSWEALHRSLEACAGAGADVLSIESVGGKEVHDQALLYGDVHGVIFALGILAPRDMEFLWNAIVGVARTHGIVAGGDSACGFANTAMQLAGQGMLPEVLASVVRAASAVRSLVAFSAGAVGPSKDCAYEGPVLKAITGAPIAMEGKSATCAHFSPVGNVAAAVCDLWSNESVQNVRLLSGSAPEAFLESLAYDCRVMNEALRTGQGRAYRDLLVASDVGLSPQALVLSPDSTLRIARAIVGERTPYAATCAAAREAASIVRDALRERRLELPARELQWLGKIERALGDLPVTEEEMIASMAETYGHLYRPASYGL
ncbi:MAG TPA: methyltransferase MtaB domain-containing protein [Bacteroidota bacterium]|nr:methyltransferase MtaB domain-containing protein [Bacteroidota bacterium]